jgi:hypothetical protein
MPENDNTERLGKVSRGIAAELMIVTNFQEMLVFGEPDENGLRSVSMNSYPVNFRVKILGSLDEVMIPKDLVSTQQIIAFMEDLCSPDIEVGQRIVVGAALSERNCRLLFMQNPVSSIMVKRHSSSA